jgi:hypothetical protein
MRTAWLEAHTFCKVDELRFNKSDGRLLVRRGGQSFVHPVCYLSEELIRAQVGHRP